jgi:hypothetical protein
VRKDFGAAELAPQTQKSLAWRTVAERGFLMALPYAVLLTTWPVPGAGEEAGGALLLADGL